MPSFCEGAGGGGGGGGGAPPPPPPQYVADEFTVRASVRLGIENPKNEFVAHVAPVEGGAQASAARTRTTTALTK